ncbi:G-type lectin S-receptor-like serine/threonine-protein kinase At4g27290 [Morus notabilis]|uniref:G-type lectin S-receptor-like serine/threonine-protein kinase At4g27290 n=1 Tax=Morus notabilis TaxID=981085 RepID=UPI000CECFA9B|nr:G-type lectin S-receptor-like serine/threonine-protein kinase At4g27290 [Morus notabilis]
MALSSFCLYIIASMFLSSFITFSFAADSIGLNQSISDGTTLVSKEGMFELGFFSPGNSKNRYVGIWYKNITVQTVVWVANRCNPINDSSGVLTMNSTGNLVLLYQNKSVVWSTNSSKQAQKPILQLLDSGNLIVRDEEDGNSENYLWERFEEPSNILLPGMKLGLNYRKGLNWRISAWRNWDDPCPENFTWGVEIDVQQQRFPEAYFRQGVTKSSRFGPWNGVTASGIQLLKPNNLYDFYFVYNEEEAYYFFNLKSNAMINIVVLNQTTMVSERIVWAEDDKSWSHYDSFPTEQCDSYGLCGGNGNCVIGDSPVCQCMKGFKPKYPEKWLTEWSDGCTRNTPLDCKDKDNDGFVEFVNLKLPDTAYARANTSMNLKECRAKCLSNCSCMAYANSDIRNGGSGCIMWFGDLMDIRKVSSSEQVLYLRMPASELGNSDSKVGAVILAAGIVGFCGVLLLGYFIYRKKSKDKSKKNGDQEEDLELPSFELSTLITATDNFSSNNRIGQGGFGPVYRGQLKDGQAIAVKRLSINSGQGIDELKNEVILIAKLQHRNLVKLLGCCIHGKEKILIYEYMPNKSLDLFIFDKNSSKLLGWRNRFEIIRGIARGLLYLHQDSRLRIIHRDLKTSNVLLDNEMNPKISDFGLARTFGGDQIEGNTNSVVGTYGYMAPEYVHTGHFSVKSDVFSFGIMVLEIVSGKRSTSFSCVKEDLTLTGHAWTLMQEGRAIELLDPCLRDSQHNVLEVLRCIHVGLLCVQHRAADRPGMSSVVVMLSSDSHALPCPNRPGYFMEIEEPQQYPDSSLSSIITIASDAEDQSLTMHSK